MRFIDRSHTALSAISRRWAARLPSVVGQRVGPSAVVFQLSRTIPGDRVDASAKPESPDWHRLRNDLVDLVAQRGTLPVAVSTVGRPLCRQSLELVRLAHRLDCPVHVWTDGAGLSGEGAGQLVDVGLSGVTVMVGGLDDATQSATVGNTATEATEALVALLAARAETGSRMRVELGLPWLAGVEGEARGVVGWAHQIGVDDVMLVPPSHGGGMAPVEGHWLQTLSDLGVRGVGRAERSFLALLAVEQGDLPGVARDSAGRGARWRPCPVVGTRMTLTPDGSVGACPFLPPMHREDSPVVEAWAADRSHREAVQACGRRCRHPALALGPGLLGTR